jgi:hypothetical protein
MKGSSVQTRIRGLNVSRQPETVTIKLFTIQNSSADKVSSSVHLHILDRFVGDKRSSFAGRLMNFGEKSFILLVSTAVFRLRVAGGESSKCHHVGKKLEFLFLEKNCKKFFGEKNDFFQSLVQLFLFPISEKKNFFEISIYEKKFEDLTAVADDKNEQKILLSVFSFYY